MAKCTLSLDLDHSPDVPLRAGETLSGHVVVDVDKEVRCRKLTIDFFWRTHGSGNRASGNPQRMVLFEGTWSEGELLRYPFSFRVPDGPATYHGEVLNVDWYLNANADIPWAFDPKAEEDFILDCSTGNTYDHGPRFKAGMNPEGVLGSAVQTFVGLFFMAISSIFVCVGVGVTVSESIIGLAFVFFPLIFTAVGAWMVFSAWRSKMAETLLGEIEVEVPPSIQPGESFPVLVHCAPKRDIALRNLRIALKGEEVVVRGSGTNRSTYRRTVFEQEERQAENTSLPAGQHAIFEQTFTMPEDAGPSFAATDNELRWTIDLQFDLPRWPDWVGSHVLAVRPRRS